MKRRLLARVAYCLVVAGCSRTSLDRADEGSRVETGAVACSTPGSCASTSDCCPFEVCRSAKCTARCRPEGSPCEASGDCCSGTCETGICRRAGLGACLQAGAACTAASTCCSGECVRGRCTASPCYQGEPPIKVAKTGTFPRHLTASTDDLFLTHQGGLLETLSKYGGAALKLDDSAGGIDVSATEVVWVTDFGVLRAADVRSLETATLGSFATEHTMDLAGQGNRVLWTSLMKDSLNHYDLIELDRSERVARVAMKDVSARFAVTADGIVFSKDRNSDHLLRMPLATRAVEDTGVVISGDLPIEVPAIRVTDKFVVTCDDVGLLMVPIDGGPPSHHKLPWSCVDIAVRDGHRLFVARAMPTPSGEAIVTVYNLMSKAVERELSLPDGTWQPTAIAADDKCVYLAAMDDGASGAIFRFAR